MGTPLPWFVEPDEIERTILRLVAQGYGLDVIGRRLSLSHGGVTSRLTGLRRRWRLRTVRQLLVLAGGFGWAAVPGRHIEQQQSRRQPRHRLREALSPPDAARHPWKGAR